MVDYKVIAGIFGAFAIILIVGASQLLQSDYLQILKENPNQDMFLIDFDSSDHLEFMGRAPSNIDARYVLWKFFKGANIRFYYEKTDVVADAYFKIFDGSTQIVFREDQQINYTPVYDVSYLDSVILCDDLSEEELFEYTLPNGTLTCMYKINAPIKRADVIQKVDYFLDSRHTNYIGQLNIITNTYPSKGKITIEWYPKIKDK